jgi:outer membrane lipoprotein-sorting protein
MKIKISLFVLLLVLCVLSCKKENPDTLGGTQSPMGEVGETVSTSSSAIAGVSSVSGTVVSLENGVSSFTGSAIITNSTIKNILLNHPQTVINGNNVTVSDIELRITSEGIESINGLESGIIVKYDSNVGDSYSISNGKERTVTSKSTDNDYFWGGMNIKVLQIEENTNKLGVKKTVYWANHRFGLVGIEFTFDDNTTAKFPIYSSTQNDI